MNQEERMKANLPYKAWLDGLAEKRMECKKSNFTNNRSTKNFERKKIIYNS